VAIPRIAAVAVAVVAICATAIVAASVIAVIPGSDPNKDAVNKEARPVITIGRAVVRIVVVVAVGADRFRSNVGVCARVIVGVIVVRTYRDAHRNLCRRVSYGEEKGQDSQQRNVF